MQVTRNQKIAKLKAQFAVWSQAYLSYLFVYDSISVGIVEFEYDSVNKWWMPGFKFFKTKGKILICIPVRHSKKT